MARRHERLDGDVVVAGVGDPGFEAGVRARRDEVTPAAWIRRATRRPHSRSDRRAPPTGRGLDAIYLPIGSGTSAAGACLVRDALAPTCRVVGVQSAHEPAAHDAWRAHAPRTAPCTPRASGLATAASFALPPAILREGSDDRLLVDDAALDDARRLLATHAHTLAERAGAAGLAGLLADPARPGRCTVHPQRRQRRRPRTGDAGGVRGRGNRSTAGLRVLLPDDRSRRALTMSRTPPVIDKTQAPSGKPRRALTMSRTPPRDPRRIWVPARPIRQDEPPAGGRGPAIHCRGRERGTVLGLSLRGRARVAEWQTRTVQVRVSVRTWRFNSSLAHNDVWSPDYIKSPLTRTSVLLSCGLPWTRMAFRGLPFPTYSPRFPTYSPRHPGRGERRRRRPLSTRPSFGPLRSVTGGAHHG